MPSFRGRGGRGRGRGGRNDFRNDFNEDTGKSLPEALLFAEHGENMLCTEIVLNVKKKFLYKTCFPILS